MGKKHKKICTALNYIEHYLTLASTVANCISISAFASLLDIPIGITSSAIVLNFFPTTGEIKKDKSIRKRKKRKTKLNSIGVLISTALLDSYISHGEFVSVNNVLKNMM